MKIIYLKNLNDVSSLGEVSIALGFFDSLHTGHQELIKEAKNSSYKSAIFTFSKNPSEVIKNVPYECVNSLGIREEILSSFGIDYFIILETTKENLMKDKEEFISDFLIKIGAKKVVCGFDFSFGKNGEGKPSDLLAHPEFETKIIGEIKNDKDEKISSTLIKKLIREGNVEEANSYMLRPFTMEGKVIYGYQLGRTINFETANLEVSHNFVMPKNGVYASKFIIDGKSYFGMTNVGIHPTVNKLAHPSIETNIFDFHEDIYNKDVRLEFIKMIRDEKKFADVNALKTQLIQDKKEIQEYFSKLGK